MSYLQLKPHVSFALVGGRTVFLDLKRDCYLALDPGTEEIFGRIREDGGALPREAQEARRLLATNLFETTGEPRPLSPVQIAVPESTAARKIGPFSLRDCAEVWLRLAHVRFSLKARPLHRVIARHQPRPPNVDAPEWADRAVGLAGRFQAARALVPVRPTCLPDSLALRAWLAARGAAASIVFGVKLDPFAAHCWVQTETMVLSDAPDVIGEFTPILVVP